MTITYAKSLKVREDHRSPNRILRVYLAYKAADHEGYHHSAYDWWIFDARMTSPKTCEVCKALDLTDWRGDWIPDKFPYHTHQSVNAVRAMVHPNCRCRLRWAGRAKEIYQTPLGLQVREVWRPTEKELEQLSPSQLETILSFLRSPW